MTLNFGKLYEHAFESRYSLYRRFMSVNTGLSQAQIRTKLDTYIGESPGYNYNLRATEGINKIVKYITQTSKAKDAFNLNIRDIEYPIKQCPLCATELFHTPIYDLPWMVRCPIHNVELMEKCPKCHQNWLGIRKLYKGCSYCGIPDSVRTQGLSTNLENRAKLQKIYSLISNIISSRVMDGYDGSDYIGRSFSPLNSMLIPTIAIRQNLVTYEDAASLGMHIEEITCTTYSVRTVVDKLNPFSRRDYYQKHDDIYRKIRNIVFEKIRINVLINYGHRINLKPTNIFSNRCSYCVAFKYWKEITQKFDTELADHIPDVLYWSLEHIPSRPSPSCYISNTDLKLYSTPLDFQIIQYEHDLLSTYWNLYKAFSHVLPQLKDTPSGVSFASVNRYEPAGRNWNLYDKMFILINGEHSIKVFVSKEEIESIRHRETINITELYIHPIQVS